MDCKVFRVVWLTDIDNTLLPTGTERSGVDLELLGGFLRELERHCVLVVPVTFKTLSEVKYLSSLMGYEFPVAVVEGGCAVVFNEDLVGGSRGVLELCRGRSVVDAALEAFNDPCKGRLSLLTGLDAGFASKVLDIPGEEAKRALKRAHSELVYSEDEECIEKLAEFVERVGLKATRSRRILHVTEVLKGDAARLLLKMLSQRVTGPVIASGDSAADREFLELADTPIVVSGNAHEWFRKYPYISVWGGIPRALIDYVSRVVLLKAWDA